VVGFARWPGGTPGLFPAPPHLSPTVTPVPAATLAQCRRDPATIPAPPPAAANYLHTCGSQLYDAHGQLVQITGVSWFGFETSNMAPDGLWARNWQTILDQLAALHYNLIRLPFSDDVLKPGAMPSGIDYLLNPDLKGLTSLQIMDKIVAGARQRGLRILLDRHRPTSAGQSDLWYTPQVSQAKWIADWEFLARRYKGNDTVIGADIDNEPRGPATWGSGDPATDWHLAAEKAGDAILAINPYWLIFVEGIEHTGNDWYWWGGDLEGVAKYPVVLNVPDRVVYSPHDYGPSVYAQGWFKAANFPANLPSVWDKHWGYIAEEGLAPVVLGEFGGRSVGSNAEGEWQRSLIAYLAQHQIGWISWALNPDSGDTGGLLQDNWLTVQSAKNALYAPHLAAPIPASAAASRLPPLRLTYHNASPGYPASSISFEVTLFNDRSQAIPLSSLTLRYWIAGDPAATAAVVDWAYLGTGQVQTKVVPDACGRQRGYIDVSFDSGAGNLVGYGTTGPVLIRYHRGDWAPIDPTHDFSFGASPTDQDWSKVQVYQAGRLIWGAPPACH
jgi:endoglucanase